MKMDLLMHGIGFPTDLPEAIELAHRHRFASVGPDAVYLARLSDRQLDDLRTDLQAKGLVFSTARLVGVDFRGDETAFTTGLQELPLVARALQRAGAPGVGAWIKPTHDTLTYLANFNQHVRRLGVIAQILGDHGLRLGLEYLAPRTAWTAGRHSFIHTLAETRELIAALDRPNVGLVLDSWHWHNAGETEADLLALSGRDILACDLNDAPAGIPREQLMDLSRELPCETGVIDLRTFLGALAKIGYQGPVRAEPFNAAFRRLPREEAVARAAQSLRRAFSLIAPGVD